MPLTSSPIGNDHVCFYLHSTTGHVVRQMGQRYQRVSVLEPHHTVATSFHSFLSTHLSRLQSGMYEVKEPTRVQSGVAPGISRFVFPDPCGSDSVTRGIRVQTSVLFVSEECEAPERFFFTYRIRITHTGESAVDATLATRKWQITNARGHEDVVEGEGVIGLYPVSYILPQ